MSMDAIIETTRMSTRGQLIVPRKTRAFTGSGMDTLFLVTPLDKNTILLKKMDTEHMLQEFQKIRASVKNHLSENAVNELVHDVRHARASRPRH